MAPVHTAALVQSDFATIAAICDIDTAKLVKTAAEIPYPVRTYTDYKTMLAEVKPEVVHVCTPHFLHKPMAIDSMLAGADVYLEKPAALNYEEGLEILNVENRPDGTSRFLPKPRDSDQSHRQNHRRFR